MSGFFGLFGGNKKQPEPPTSTTRSSSRGYGVAVGRPIIDRSYFQRMKSLNFLQAFRQMDSDFSEAYGIPLSALFEFNNSAHQFFLRRIELGLKDQPPSVDFQLMAKADEWVYDVLDVLESQPLDLSNAAECREAGRILCWIARYCFGGSLPEARNRSRGNYAAFVKKALLCYDHLHEADLMLLCVIAGPSFFDEVMYTGRTFDLWRCRVFLYNHRFDSTLQNEYMCGVYSEESHCRVDYDDLNDVVERTVWWLADNAYLPQNQKVIQDIVDNPRLYDERAIAMAKRLTRVI